jgi:hypothetical protein
MTRNHDDLKKEFGNSWEKEIGITYERWLEKEIQKVENEKEEYRRFAERMSVEANSLAGQLKSIVRNLDHRLVTNGEWSKI